MRGASYQDRESNAHLIWLIPGIGVLLIYFGAMFYLKCQAPYDATPAQIEQCKGTQQVATVVFLVGAAFFVAGNFDGVIIMAAYGKRNARRSRQSEHIP